MSPESKISGPIDDEPACSIERSLQILGERWALLVLREIFAGRHRFAEIQASLGVAPNLLSARLKLLVEAGVVRTRTYQEPGSRHRRSYHLTQAGEELRIVLAALQQWGDRHRPRPSGPSSLRRTRSTGEAVNVGFVDEEGREVPCAEVAFVVEPAPGD
ncbi:winged helix-turn-helix transcriptional regulator [Streptomyces iranensis]|uniref:DNA-binding HxlR family transcriptional regulator n=1 Tax=Streptomyces iranensis TaxID=576784 RepID=A0A060ZDD3_9ACTN|nr:helix-turn-helix domain-containing protein [Streptomyces iranensis]MBP2066311.1 DNA-binding HxlR family transcriptional regulator [Streptomyces iranensis]CDR02928.1 transcriptional regulator, HxlR family protein [Streptomyces iranensis]